jgi:hypothetical protein
MGRPTRRPRWGYNAPGGALVEPPSNFARLGFYTAERPPAQWVNYLLHFTAAWCDYLAGPGWGAWERLAHGGSAPTLNTLTAIAVDTNDLRARAGVYRYVIAGVKSGPTPTLAVSRTGREWLERDPPTLCDAIRGIAPVGSQWLLWGTGPDAKERIWNTPASGSGSAIQASDDEDWTVAEVLELLVPRGLAHDGAGEAWVACDDGAGDAVLVRSRDDGATWPFTVAMVVDNGARICDIVWDAARSRYLLSASDGKTYTFVGGSSNALAPGGSAPDATPGSMVHLRVGGDTCVAWARADYDGVALGWLDVWRSEDGGGTWAAVTLPVAFGPTATDVTYAEGVWLITSTSAPYLWRSDDDAVTWERVPLPLDEESWALYRAVYADGAVTASGLTWTVATTRATGLSPDSSRVYSPEPGYLADAGYLRGRRIASTPPTDNQVLVWNAGTGRWTPSTPAAGMSNPMTSVGDLIVGSTAGAPARLALGGASTLLSSDGVTLGYDAAPWTVTIAPASIVTTNATPTEVVAEGAPGVACGASYDLHIVASYRDLSACYSWRVQATISDDGASGVTLRDVVVTPSNPSAPVTIALSIVSAHVVVTGTGVAATTIDWAARGSVLVCPQGS